MCRPLELASSSYGLFRIRHGGKSATKKAERPGTGTDARAATRTGKNGGFGPPLLFRHERVVTGRATPDRWRGSDRLADTGAMPKRPSPDKPQPTPLSWDIYRAANKAKLIGSVEAGDAEAAIEKAAIEFKTDAWRLIATRRR